MNPEPVAATEVNNRRWPTAWWNDVWGLVYRHPIEDAKHLAAGDLLFVMHPCESIAHRPARTTPTREGHPPT